MVQFNVPSSIIDLLQDIKFPCTAEELIKFAEERGVPEEFLGQLRAMPNHIFKSTDELSLTWGFLHEFKTVEETGLAAPPPSTEDTLSPTPVPAATESSDGGEGAAP